MLAVTLYVPAVVGVPLIRPVEAVTCSPVGSPVAEYVSASPLASVACSCSTSDCPASLV
jgi:hypothetical protein